MPPGRKDSPRVLVVEGSDDLHFLAAVTNTMFGPRSIEVVDSKGVQNLLGPSYLQARLDQSNLERLGIVMDADSRPGERWSSLRNRLVPRGFELPEHPSHGGCIVNSGGIRVGVWMMPDNVTPGALEELLLRLVPAGDDLLPLAVEAVESIPSQSRRFGQAGVKKAEVRTWLAWQEEPGPPLEPRGPDASSTRSRLRSFH